MRLKQFGVAAGAVLVAALIRWLLEPALGNEYRFTILFLAVVFVAWFGGFAPSMFALALSCAVASLMHAFPGGAAYPRNSSDAVGLFVYLLMGTAVALVGESQLRSAAALKSQAEALSRANEHLRVEGKARLAAQDELLASQRELAEINSALEDTVESRSAQLREAIGELERFSYSIAHDMRAPLRAVNAACRLIEEEHADKLGREGCELLQSAQRASVYMGRFIDDLLEYGRLSRISVRSQRIDLSNLAESSAAKVRRSEPDLEVEVASGLVVVADRYLLGLALEALLENACKFRAIDWPPYVKVTLTLKAADQTISVADNGIGFDMRYERRIFEPFQKLHRDAEFPGTGIGLAKVQRIAGLLGGKVWAESEEGRGAVFHLVIPLGARSSPKQAVAENPEHDQREEGVHPISLL